MNLKLPSEPYSQTNHTITYKDIFNQRGKNYHYAMTKYPLARQQEFSCLIQLLDLSNGDKVLDIPSGGAYLSNYTNNNIEIYSVDDAEQFLQTDIVNNKYCCNTLNTPFPNNTFDKAYSLAGSHHMPDKTAFYKEVQRVLKPGGTFAYADVADDSDTGHFLNTFVNQYNSMGHLGDFLTMDQTITDLEASSFRVESAFLCSYQWEFDSQMHAVTFMKNLFGLDLATNEDVLNGINQYLTVQSNKNIYNIDWQLLHFKAVA